MKKFEKKSNPRNVFFFFLNKLIRSFFDTKRRLWLICQTQKSLLFRSWFLFFLFQPPVSSTALSIREICEKIWTSPIREIRKIFRNASSAKLNPRESVKISRME